MKTPPRNRDAGPTGDKGPTLPDGRPHDDSPPSDPRPTGDTDPRPTDTRRYRALRPMVTRGLNGGGVGTRRQIGDIISAQEFGSDADIRFFIQHKVIEPADAPTDGD